MSTTENEPTPRTQALDNGLREHYYAHAFREPYGKMHDFARELERELRATTDKLERERTLAKELNAEVQRLAAELEKGRKDE